MIKDKNTGSGGYQDGQNPAAGPEGRIKKRVVAKYRHDGNGIVTGPHNPASVGLNMYVLESGESASFFRLKKWHEGHRGIGHGGITASILDETMGYSNHAREHVLGLDYTPVFTGTATFTYLKPVMLDDIYYSYARIERIEGRKRFISGEILDSEGRICVKGEGIFIAVFGKTDPDEIIEMAELTADDPAEL